MNPFRLIGLLVAVIVAALSWMATCGAWQLEEMVAQVGPLDPREFPELTLITLGTGGAYENPARRGPATGVALGDQVWVVDAGRGIAEGLRLAQIPVSQPETVLLTNLLPENTVGLDDLLLTGWLDGRSQPLRLIGPAGTRELAEALQTAHARSIAARSRAFGLPEAGARFDVEEIADGWSGSLGEARIVAGALPGGPLEAFAYRIESGGRSAVIAGTGWSEDALIAFASGANLLLHEGVFIPTPDLARQLGMEEDLDRLRGEAALHTSIDDVGGLAQRAGIETLALVRLRPPPVYDIQITSRVELTFSGKILIPEDGDEIEP